MEKNAHIKASLNNETQDPLNLSYQNTLTLFKIAQESLSNTARHAQAKKTDLRLWEENGRIYLEILDDGVGFNIDKTEANLGHGLANMQRRSRKASALKSSHHLEKAPGLLPGFQKTRRERGEQSEIVDCAQ